MSQRPIPCLRLGLAVASLLLVTACTHSDSNALLPRPPSNETAKAWVARRSQELEASGLKPGDAALKASDEWAHSHVDGTTGTDTYTIYDSAAKQKAEQKALNDGFEKMQRDGNK